MFVTLPQPFTHDRVETLPVIVDDPPAVAQAMLPAFEYRLENVALIKLGVADERNHPALGTFETPTVGAHVILGQRGEQSLRDPQPNRASGKVDVVGVFGARRIGLRAFVTAKAFEFLQGLFAE